MVGVYGLVIVLVLLVMMFRQCFNYSHILNIEAETEHDDYILGDPESPSYY